MTLYDTIGAQYSARRRADPRIAATIADALGDAASVVNVGAGTGSYEPSGPRVVAVEPSAVMVSQRTASSTLVVQGRAEALPFGAKTFDAALAVLTVHHWSDCLAGLRECARVARSRVVLLTWDPGSAGFWLVQDYFPDLLAHDRRTFPRVEELCRVLEDVAVRPVPIPADCLDGFLGAYWHRPEAYLSSAIRSGMSSFARVSSVLDGVERLRAELANGAWDAKYGGLRSRAELDVGYRIVIGSPSWKTK